jgi:hypothetical protein
LEGVKYDGEKPMMQLLPPRALVEVAKVLTLGAKKYAPDNWKKLDNLSGRYTGAALRHIFEHMIDPEAIDPESGVTVLAHAVCDLLFIIEDKLEKSQNEGTRETNFDEHRTRSEPVGVELSDNQKSGVRDIKHFLQYYSSLQDYRGVEG